MNEPTAPAGPAGSVGSADRRDPARSLTSRIGELPREIPPPHDGWPALEARLREICAPAVGGEEPGGARDGSGATARAVGRTAAITGGIAAVLAAVAVGISIDRLLLRAAPPRTALAPAARNTGPARGDDALAAAFITDPRYLREREALLRSLHARLEMLPPPTRQKVLASLATIHRSMQQIQQALGREPGNALLQELLVDTYQDEMRVLTAVQGSAAVGGET